MFDVEMDLGFGKTRLEYSVAVSYWLVQITRTCFRHERLERMGYGWGMLLKVIFVFPFRSASFDRKGRVFVFDDHKGVCVHE